MDNEKYLKSLKKDELIKRLLDVEERLSIREKQLDECETENENRLTELLSLRITKMITLIGISDS